MRNIKYYILAIIAILAVQLVCIPTCFAQGEEGRIKKIQVKGSERTENSTVISYSELKQGEEYSKSKANSALKKLYSTGFFSNVSISFEQGTVTILVEENPIINRIDFKGNKSLKRENILPEISLKTRGYFSKNKLQGDVNRIMDLYNKMGIFSVTIDPKISKLSQNRVNVLFEINEGGKIKIEKISFIGNKKFSGNDLRQVLASKENRIFNLFRINYYNPDAIEYDKVALKRFYSSKGYPNCKVVSVNAEIMPTDMERVYLTFVLDEGVRYNFGKINLDNKIPSIKKEDLLKLINIKSGDTFDGSQVEEVNTKIIKYLAEKGFPFVKVDYDYNLHKDKKLADVYYKVSKAPKVYIGKINISGNSKTYDYVIRREFRLSEGDPYNGFLVDRSKQRIENLDYFKTVSVTPERTKKQDVVDLDVKVEEKSTASMKLSAGYSTTDGLLGMINFSEINWLGRGQKISLGLQKSVFTTGINVGYSEPHFKGSEVEVGGNLGFSKQKNDAKGGLADLGSDHSHMAFNEESYSAGVFINYDITEYLNHNVDYSITRTKVSSVNEKAKIPIIVKEELKKSLTSAIGHTLSYDKSDSAIKPTKGYIVSLSQNLAGLGGNIKYLRNILKAAYYYPIMEDLTLKIAGEGGHINRIDNKYPVRITDNFYLGEYSFKGFDYAGIGPRDTGEGKYALGAVSYYKALTELMFPFPGVSRDLDLSTSIFVNAGSAWDIDMSNEMKKKYPKSSYYNKKSIRAAGGIGFIWITRAGPIRIDFAQAFKKEKFDQTKTFLFSFQTAL